MRPRSGAPTTLGVAVTGSYAPSADLATAAFVGTARDDVLAAVARWPIALGARKLRLAVLAGGALHVVGLRGTAGDGTAVATTRYDPAVRGGAVVGFAVDPSVDVGVSLSADYLVERQRFDFDTTEIL